MISLNPATVLRRDAAPIAQDYSVALPGMPQLARFAPGAHPNEFGCWRSKVLTDYFAQNAATHRKIGLRRLESSAPPTRASGLRIAQQKQGHKMTHRIMAELSNRYRINQENLLELVAGLTDEEIAWTPNATIPSIGFHVWHLARWADYLQELMNGRGSQIWEIDGLAARWNMDTKSLGYAQTGMEMDEQAALALRLPEKNMLLGYARRSFAAAQHAIARIRDDEFFRVYECLHGEIWHEGQIGPIVLTWMTHDNRHLGMIECLVGLQGQSGSADA